MMILVAGATGELGGLITRRLLTQEHHVRILVRPSSNYAPLVGIGAQYVPGDLKDLGSLVDACHEIDVVVTTVNAARRGGADTHQTVDLDGNRALIEAARKARVRQFIFVSAYAADAGSSSLFLQAKARTEAVLERSGLPYTILAPDMFMQSWIMRVIGQPAVAGRPVTLLGNGEDRHAFVAVEDVAALAVASVSHPAALNRRMAIGGPDVLSWREAVQVVGRVLGRPLLVQTVPIGTPLPGLSEPSSQFLTLLCRHESPINARDIAYEFGVWLTSLEAFVQAEILPLQETGTRKQE